MTEIAADRIVNDPLWRPRWGWHDDHRAHDGLPQYLPAVQQVRDEFIELMVVLESNGLLGGSCLQLGVGPCAASHALWQGLFSRVVSVDRSLPTGWIYPQGVSGDTHDPRVIDFVRGTYDFLFIDAGHNYGDVLQDHASYAPMVRPGGIVAFHDALRREAFGDGLEVWRYLEDSGLPVTVIGTEVGVACYVRER